MAWPSRILFPCAARLAPIGLPSAPTGAAWAPLAAAPAACCCRIPCPAHWSSGWRACLRPVTGTTAAASSCAGPSPSPTSRCTPCSPGITLPARP
ncbi:hypothetical protein G6F56_014544 [Rhizopus delemar]|nr:hypothetical protein G6F56_014544 [Rhizopus delemar]